MMIFNNIVDHPYMSSFEYRDNIYYLRRRCVKNLIFYGTIYDNEDLREYSYECDVTGVSIAANTGMGPYINCLYSMPLNVIGFAWAQVYGDYDTGWGTVNNATTLRSMQKFKKLPIHAVYDFSEWGPIEGIGTLWPLTELSFTDHDKIVNSFNLAGIRKLTYKPNDNGDYSHEHHFGDVLRMCTSLHSLNMGYFYITNDIINACTEVGVRRLEDVSNREEDDVGNTIEDLIEPLSKSNIDYVTAMSDDEFTWVTYLPNLKTLGLYANEYDNIYKVLPELHIETLDVKDLYDVHTSDLLVSIINSCPPTLKRIIGVRRNINLDRSKIRKDLVIKYI